MWRHAFIAVILFLVCTQTNTALALDIVRYEQGQSKLDTRIAYKKEVLRLALEYTKHDYGPYDLTTDAPRMNNRQAINQLQSGETINVFIALTNQDWESQTIPIRIPIRRGILSYRLLLTHKMNLAPLSRVKTIDELKQHVVGLRQTWSITKVFDELEFSILKVAKYDGLFKMLNSRRFSYIPRGVNEVFSELEQRKNELTNLVIEPNLALYIPAPTYVFVSPKYPRLAKRLEAGLELMVKNGSLEALFDAFYGECINKANLPSRHLLSLPNPQLPKETPFNRKELWFDPFKD